MNMETIKGPSRITEQYDHCEHLKIGEMSYRTFCEDDSFGPVARNGTCKECWEEHCNMQKITPTTCPNCSREVMESEIVTWVRYDHYPPQGDTPMTLCNICYDEPTHIERMKNDAIDAENENSYYN